MNAAQNETAPVNERLLILTVALIQFVNMMDFVMVMPLGPDFAKSLNIPTSDIGLIGGIYAFAAAFSGFFMSFFVDRFPRKRAILFFLVGLSIATLGGAIAWNKASMLTARILAGVFGGPLTALSTAIIADYIPPARRGEAMGKVMGGFSLATVLGIPFGLELAQMLSWHLPFIVTFVIGMGVFFFGLKSLPYQHAFANNVMLRQRLSALGELLSSRIVVLSYVLIFASMWAAFIIIPNISAHIQLNLGYPRARLGLLYFVGGILTFFTMRGAGYLIDKTSASLVSVLSTALFIVVLLVGFIFFHPGIPVLAIFVAFMVAMTTRNICGQAVFSKIPPPAHRGAYNSLQMALVNMTQALAAWASSLILVEENGKLLHIPTLGWISLVVSLSVPILFYWIERHLKKTY